MCPERDDGFKCVDRPSGPEHPDGKENMKSKLQHFSITLILGILAVTVRAQNATVTLLPTRDNAVEQGPEGSKGLLWLQKQTLKTINLSFRLDCRA